MNNICVIPAKSGSKRIPNKNFKEFYGKPIIEYSIDVAVKSKLFHDVLVAFDNMDNFKIQSTINSKQKILYDIFLRHSDNIGLYNRKSENSRDESTIFDLIKEMYDNNTINNYEKCCILYPCAPFTTIEHLKIGLTRLEKDDINCVFPIVKKSIYGSYQNDIVYSKDYKTNNFLTMDGYYHAGQWFWINIKEIIKSGKIIQNENGYIELKDYEAQDINTIEDWRDAEIKYRIINDKIKRS